MNAIAIPDQTLPAIGALYAGGYFAGRVRVGEDLFALVVAPKDAGEHEDVRWNKSLKLVDGAGSFSDGYANTAAMAEAGSSVATWATQLRISDYDDWYLPSRDELELLYRHFKPGTRENWVYRNGDNPSSVPPGYPYSAAAPGQTDVYSFRAGGPDALDETWYWTSTQYASNSDYAGCQTFHGGNQNINRKDYKLRARAVRRTPI